MKVRVSDVSFAGYTLSWESVSGADFYEVAYGDYGGTEFTTVFCKHSPYNVVLDASVGKERLLYAMVRTVVEKPLPVTFLGEVIFPLRWTTAEGNIGIDYPFTFVDGQLKTVDKFAMYVSQIKQVLLTYPGTRVMRRGFGLGIIESLFGSISISDIVGALKGLSCPEYQVDVRAVSEEDGKLEVDLEIFGVDGSKELEVVYESGG